MTTRADMARERLEVINRRISELEPWSRFTATQLVQLMKPLSENRVSHRSQGGTSLSYVEAHDIKNMLIRVFGFGGFSSEVIRETITPGEWFKNERSGKDNVRVICTATVQITLHPPARRTEVLFEPIRFTETAVSSQTGADEGDTGDFAMKTAESDAFKRAAIFMGTQFGLSLYANGATQDQVMALFEETQRELLALGMERDSIHAFLRQEAAGGARKAPSTPSTEGATNGADAGASSALAGGFAHPEGRA